MIKLLGSRMLNEKTDNEKIFKIAKKFTKGYVDHGFCINYSELHDIGINVKELTGKELDFAWEIYRLYKRKRKEEEKIKKDEIKDFMESIPLDVLKGISIPGELNKKERDNSEK
jgi:hypothetical protein